MSPARVIGRRTAGSIVSWYSSALAIGGFLAVTAIAFVLNLNAADGGRLTALAVWAMSVSPIVPVLASVLAMDTWSGERQSGRIDSLLSLAISEGELVLGKFLGVWVVVAFVTGLSLAASLGVLAGFAPAALAGFRFSACLPALGALWLQGALWCAMAVAVSAMFTRGAAAACTSIALTAVLPRALWAGWMAWTRDGRVGFGELPLDAQIVDMATGLVPVDVVLAYLALTCLALFVATRFVKALRLVGNGARGQRLATAAAVALALVFGALLIGLAARTELTLEVPVANRGSELSRRTRSLLSEATGNITLTSFVSRRDPRFREIARLMRQIRRESIAVGGARVELQYVDPNWDLGMADRLVRRGVTEESLVIENGRRLAVVPVKEGLGERNWAVALQRILTPPRRRVIYWSVGHGESAFDAYGVFGMSDIARELVQEGYRNQPIDLAAGPQIPGDCALIVVAGAREDFSRVELGRVDAYLREGGRLLVLLGSEQSGGLVSKLPSWGLRAVRQPLPEAKTLSGSDVLVSSFSAHAIAAPLRHSRVILEKPVAFQPSAVAETGAGVDRTEFIPVASVGDAAVVAAVERGAGAGQDLAIRPMRIVAIGDATMVMNGPLAARSNANRDLFLNCVAYLSGTDVPGADGSDAERLDSAMDRDCQFRYVLTAAVGIPLAVFLLMSVWILRRRRRQ